MHFSFIHYYCDSVQFYQFHYFFHFILLFHDIWFNNKTGDNFADFMWFISICTFFFGCSTFICCCTFFRTCTSCTTSGGLFSFNLSIQYIFFNLCQVFYCSFYYWCITSNHFPNHFSTTISKKNWFTISFKTFKRRNL